MSGLRNSKSTAVVDGVHDLAVEEDKQGTGEETQQLLKDLVQGDVTAFWGLWERYCDDLYPLCLRWMQGNRADAEDALSSAMLKAWRKLPDCAMRITNIKGWLMRLTHNLCVDIQRERRRRTEGGGNKGGIAEAYNEEALVDMENPEKTFADCELNTYVRGAIADLPPRLRESCDLRFFREMPYQDIARHLNLSPENVRKRVQHARAILRERLRTYFSGQD